MNELLNNINWVELIQAIWTIVLVPVITWCGKELHDWSKTKRIDKYTDMLYLTVTNVVKDLYQTTVGELKNTDEWTPAKQAEIREIAKTKIIQNITTDGYKLLRTVNTDFELWLESLIEAAIYDEKKYG